MKNMIGIAGIIAFVSAGSCIAADAAGGSFEQRLNVSDVAGIKVAAPAAPSAAPGQPGPGQHQFPPPGPGHHPGGPGGFPGKVRGGRVHGGYHFAPGGRRR